jgi:hypothetical protein
MGTRFGQADTADVNASTLRRCHEQEVDRCGCSRREELRPCQCHDRKPWTRGNSRETLIPLSETKFAAYFGWQLHFVTDTSGVATQVVCEATELDVHDVSATKRK